MFCLIFLLGQNVLVTELMASLCRKEYMEAKRMKEGLKTQIIHKEGKKSRKEKSCWVFDVTSCFFINTYFPAHKTDRPVRRTVIFSLETVEKNNDECILILVTYWNQTGLLHTKISNHNTIYSP